MTDRDETRFRPAIASALLVVFGVSGAGCSTAYMPRPSGRVQVIMKGGTPAYVREGKVYEGGLFGGELDKAVQGVPEAESHARAYQGGTLGGILAAIAGGVSMGAGLGLVAVNAGRLSDERDATGQAVGATLLVGGLAAYIAGFVLVANAAPHQWDAINVYNDAIPDYPGQPAGPYGPARPMYAPVPPPAPAQVLPAVPESPAAPAPPAAPTPRAP